MFCSVGVLIFLVNNVEKHVIVKNTIISMEYAMYINFIVEFIVTVVSSITLYNILDILDQNFGVTDTRKCANLEYHLD